MRQPPTAERDQRLRAIVEESGAIKRSLGMTIEESPAAATVSPSTEAPVEDLKSVSAKAEKAYAELADLQQQKKRLKSQPRSKKRNEQLLAIEQKIRMLQQGLQTSQRQQPKYGTLWTPKK